MVQGNVACLLAAASSWAGRALVPINDAGRALQSGVVRRLIDKWRECHRQGRSLAVICDHYGPMPPVRLMARETRKRHHTSREVLGLNMRGSKIGEIATDVISDTSVTVTQVKIKSRHDRPPLIPPC